MSHAAIRLLKRRWKLTEDTVPIVERFLASWANGNTSLEVDPADITLLRANAAVGDGTDPTPLVLRGTRLQSWHLDQMETQVATKLLELAQRRRSRADTDDRDLIAKLFPDQHSSQRRALLHGFDRNLTLVTGGPGTGKTTTAARFLASLAHRNPNIRIALSAPTGKAAARLGEAVGQATLALDTVMLSARSLLELTAVQSKTVHRLLGWNARTGRCRFNEKQPLHHDIVVVDEGSMLDLELWNRLLLAIGNQTQLVVLGDDRQLESVQPGRVLAEMIAAAKTGHLKDCHIELRHSHRLSSNPGISQLANAVREYDEDTAIKTLTDPKFRDELQLFPASQIPKALDKVLKYILTVVQAASPQEALLALEKLRILCALRRGPYGVAGVNALVENRLHAEGFPAGRWAQGRPVLIKSNDPHSGLFNGDIGVVFHEPKSVNTKAWFRSPSGFRSVPVAALPNHDTAWAMTVHRSQGSEFDSVLLILPPQSHELASTELFYTAITRTKSRLVVAADTSTIRHACTQRPPRRTNLLGKLSHPDDHARVIDDTTDFDEGRIS